MSESEFEAAVAEWRADIDAEPFAYEQMWTAWTQTKLKEVASW